MLCCWRHLAAAHRKLLPSYDSQLLPPGEQAQTCLGRRRSILNPGWNRDTRLISVRVECDSFAFQTRECHTTPLCLTPALPLGHREAVPAVDPTLLFQSSANPEADAFRFAL